MMYAHSVRPHKLRKINPNDIRGGIYSSLDIIVTKRATCFVVSVPVENSFQPNPIVISTER